MKKEDKKKRFVAKATNKFGDKFDYSQVDYVSCSNPVKIICPEHGEFWQTPQCHLHSRTGCPQCGREQTTLKNVMGTEEFIEKARKVHGNKYDYSKVNCKGWFSYVTIICPEHGEFIQRVENHLKGAGCSKCANVIPQISREEYIERCKLIYGDKYDLSNIEYKNNHTAITFTCKKHGDFSMRPKKFIEGGGCPYCQKEKDFIDAAIKKHGDKYDYSKVVYRDNKTPVCIIDKERGEFWQKPSSHLNGIGNNFVFDAYAYCESIAKQYKTMLDFYMGNRRCYQKSAKRGWLHKFTWLEKGDIWEKTLYMVYIYEVSDGSVYIGLTRNMQNRDKQHRGLGKRKSNSSLLKYCESKGFEIPTPRILESGLTVTEAQASEKKWIRKYRNSYINVINKTDGGEIGGSPFFMHETNYENKSNEEIIEEARKYKHLWRIKDKNLNLYKIICENNLCDTCFPNRQKHKTPRNYTEDFILELVKKYPQKNDLRKMIL